MKNIKAGNIMFEVGEDVYDLAVNQYDREWNIHTIICLSLW